MNEAVKRRLRWRQEPSAKGLAAIGQGELGYLLMYGGEEVGRTAILHKCGRWSNDGYYWYGFGRNTASTPVATVEEAKVACERYVREQLGLPQKKEAPHG